jgi:hypothetical protein
MSELSRSLLSLGYPSASIFASSSPSAGDVAAAVIFLEDRVVRALDVSARAPLRRWSPAAPAPWHAAFAAYLEEVGCPLTGALGAALGGGAYAPARALECLEWLAGHAAGVALEERAAEINAAAAEEMEFAAVPAAEAAGAAALAAVAAAAPAAATDEPSPEVAALIADLAALLSLPTEAGAAASSLMQ